MDRKTIIAIALSLIFLFAYPHVLRMVGLGHYIDPPKPTAVSDSTAAGADTTTDLATAAPSADTPGGGDTGLRPVPGADPTQVSQPPALDAPPIQSDYAELARSIAVETPLYHAEFTNRGARLISVALKKYASAHGVSSLDGKIVRPKRGEDVPPGDRVVLAGGPVFGVDLGSADAQRSLDTVVYTVAESLDAAGDIRTLTFSFQDSSGFSIRQIYRIHPDNYAIDLSVEIEGVPRSWGVSEYSLNTRSWPLITESDLPADHRGHRASSLVGENMHREGAGGLIKKPKSFEGNARWAGVQTRYFLAAAAAVEATARSVYSSGERVPTPPAQRDLLGSEAKPEQEVVMNSLVVGLPTNVEPEHRFLLYFGPIEYSRLNALGQGYERAVDLGWRWLEPFSKALLVVLKWIHGFLGNYGVAILVLATLVRLILHPLNMTSMKSMRAMQKLQPEIERIRTKYKKDPQAMNTAMMALYKEHKVNPAGGCLPLLLQMPLFIALYSVLFNAIELRQAPFVLWINDLSAPDVLFQIPGLPIPLRLLPLLMAGTGFLQQKMMPMDPRQAPTMYLMNGLMLVFFYNLPSGLVLYWTVMNVLTIAQQWLMMRQDGGTPAPSGAVVVDEPEASPSGKGGGRRGRKARQAVARKAAGK